MAGLEFLLTDTPTDAPALEVSAGIGHIAVALAKRHISVVGVDVSLLENHSNDSVRINSHHLRYVRGEASRLPFAIASL